MTFVGKILVIVIMVFALLFLAFSTVVFTTEKNWKAEAAKHQQTVTEIQGDLQQVKGQLQIAENNRDAEKKQTEALAKEMQGRIDALQNDIGIRQQEITKQRTAVETALQNSRDAQAEAQARVEETAKLRDQLRAVQDQANEFKLQQTELNNKIELQRRELEVAKNNNQQLREVVATYAKVIQANGFDPDPKLYQDIKVAGPVDGEITRTDPSAPDRFQISIGSDDGLVPGVELTVYRLSPKPEYLGKVRVFSVDSDRAVVTLIGNTPQGKKIREGDIVSTKIRSRG
jgi:peptidoglycan hydrolase CwlO-like protein